MQIDIRWLSAVIGFIIGLSLVSGKEKKSLPEKRVVIIKKTVNNDSGKGHVAKLSKGVDSNETERKERRSGDGAFPSDNGDRIPDTDSSNGHGELNSNGVDSSETDGLDDQGGDSTE